MEKKFEKLSLAEIGIISFMGLILLISLGASWYKMLKAKQVIQRQYSKRPIRKNG